MSELHTRLAEVNRKYGLDRGDDIYETGVRHRSTAEYNRDLYRENARLETLISYKSGQLSQHEDQIKKDETRVKGLTTMIANLERQEAELNDDIAQLESDIENGAGNVSELRCRIAELENQLESTGQKPSAISTEQLNSPSHAVAETSHQTSRGDAIRMKTPPLRLPLHDASSPNDETISAQTQHEWQTIKYYMFYNISISYK